MRWKSAVKFGVYLIVVVLFALLALNGLSIGVFEIKPVTKAIKQGLDLRGGVSAVYEATDTSAEDFDDLLRGTMAVLRNRLDGQGYTEATVTKQGASRIRVEIPDVDDPNEVLSIIGQPAKLEFKDENDKVILEGKHIKKATAGKIEGNADVVNFELTDEGAKLFAEATQANIGKVIKIVLDGEEISTPQVKTAITGGTGYIDGMANIEEAKNLANLIQSGALPLDIEQIEMRSISATLGEEALSRSILAGLIGILLVMLFMIIYYRIPGVAASLALSAYMIIVLYLLAIVPGVQLTLPGIAGIILGVGMAVDANVIIFERFKEELRNGKSLHAALDAGFGKAFSAILDSNVTTIIAALVLLFFGTGPIKGFAITLIISIVVSLLSAVVLTRNLLRWGTDLRLTNIRLYGVRREAK